MSSSPGFKIEPKWSGWLPNANEDGDPSSIENLRQVWRSEAAEAEYGNVDQDDLASSYESSYESSPSSDETMRIERHMPLSPVRASINHGNRFDNDYMHGGSPNLGALSDFYEEDDDEEQHQPEYNSDERTLLHSHKKKKKRRDSHEGSVLLDLQQGSSQVQSTTYWRLFIVLFCHLGLQIGYILRVDTSVAVIPMALQFGWSSTDQGFVLAAFYIGYLVMMLPGGWIVVRFGGKWPLAASLLLSSLFTALTPVVAERSFGGLIAMRVLTGLAEAITYPANHDLMANWVPKSEHSRSVPFVFSGAFVGTIIALLAAPPIVDASGWQAVFYVFSALSLVWVVPWMLFAASTPEKHPFVSTAERIYIRTVTAESGLAVADSMPHRQMMNALDEADLFSDARVLDARSETPPWRAIFASLPVWAVCVANFANNWAFYVLLSFMPTYFSSEFSFDLDDSSLLSVLPYALMAIMGISSGYLADFVIVGDYASRTVVRKTFIVVGFMLPAVLLVAVGFVGQTPAIVMTTLATGVLGCALPGWAANHMDLSSRYAGVLLGFSNTWGTLPGAFGVYLSGFILDATNHDWSVVFGLAAIILAAGTLFFLIFGSGKSQSSLN